MHKVQDAMLVPCTIFILVCTRIVVVPVLFTYLLNIISEKLKRSTSNLGHELGFPVLDYDQAVDANLLLMYVSVRVGAMQLQQVDS